MRKPKVLILNQKLMQYRIPIYDILSEKYDLTFAYSYPYKGDFKGKFKLLKLNEPVKVGPIFIHRENIKQLCNEYDAVIMLGEIRRISLILPAFQRRKFKMAFWSIGVATSNGFDVDRRMDWLRDFIYKKADACLFYSDYARDRAIRLGYNPEKVFVDDNTVKVLPIKGNLRKDSFLFIGSLHRRKGIFSLLENYKRVAKINRNVPSLNIVGGGVELPAIQQWISDNGLSDKIRLVGAVYDDEIKREYFERAYLCISPKQAGLSVLEAMGYGVPFVTMHDAITGGERLNIKNGENGILMQKEDDLMDILLDVEQNPAKYKQMGERAYNYYWNNRTPEHMAQGISNVIEYLISRKD